MRRACIIKNGKLKLTKVRICLSCGAIVNTEGHFNMNNEDTLYVQLSTLLALHRNFKNTLCLPEKQSSRIEKLERKILFDNNDPKDLLEKIERQREHQIMSEPERIFQTICNKYNLPFRYVGNKQFQIGKLYPDFIGTGGKKICIEIMGDYWHSPLLNFKLKLSERTTLTYRKEYYRQRNWQPVFIWEADLKRNDAEQFVLNLLEKEI